MDTTLRGPVVPHRAAPGLAVEGYPATQSGPTTTWLARSDDDLNVDDHPGAQTAEPVLPIQGTDPGARSYFDEHTPESSHVSRCSADRFDLEATRVPVGHPGTDRRVRQLFRVRRRDRSDDPE